MIRIILVALFFFIPQVSFGQIQTDFNKDGVSDITFIRISTDGGLKWLYRNSKTKKKRAFATIGQNGNHVALAKWIQAQPAIPGIISLGPSNEILWSILNKGQVSTIALGSKGDLIVSGADVDGSGAADAIAIAIRNKTLIWKIKLDPFNGGGATIHEVQFGNDGDIPFFASIDSRIDQMALFRQLPHGTQQIILRNFTTSAETSSTLSSVVKDPMRPLPVRQISGPDILAVPSQSETKTSFTLFHLNGKRIRKISVKSSGEIVVGNFFSKEKGEELAVKDKSNFKIINPFTRITAAVPISADIPVDEININSFGAWGSTNTACVANNPVDGWKRGFIWKPNSDTQFYGVAILPNGFTNTTQSVTAFAADGRVINSLFSKGCANPDDEGLRCSWMATPYTGSKYKAEFGSIRLKIISDNGACATFDLNDPSKRID